MQSWRHESLFTEYVAEEDLIADSLRSHRRQPSVSPSERSAILHNTTQAVHKLQSALAGQESESYWINQLLAYLQRLQTMNAARTAEEQFSQLYYLRKWLFWVPVSLLQRQGGHGPAMLTLSYFYAVALSLEPLFPDLGSPFCGAIALAPMEAIIGVTDAMQMEYGAAANTHEIINLMQYPKQTAASYRNHAYQRRAPVIPTMPMVSVGSDTLSYASIGNISPAFAPSPLHYTPQSSSGSQSPWLEVPSTHSGFGFGTQTWGSAPSPALPTLSLQDEQMYGYMSSMGGFRGGFVPTSIWT